MYLSLTAGMMADLDCELKLEHQQQQQMPQQEPSPSAVMPGSGTSFTFSRASSIGSVNAVSCSSASSTHNTGDVLQFFPEFDFENIDDLRGMSLDGAVIHLLLEHRI